MKLIKKITFKRVMQLSQYKKVLSIFDKFKEDPNIDKHNSIKRTKDASKLNYFFVLEHENIFKNKLNLNNFIEKKSGKNDVINIEKLIDEKNKIEEYINNKKQKEPSFFHKLGPINQVLGCYLIGTNKKNINHIKDLDLKNRNNLILIKLDFKNLPKEFEELCNDYFIKTQEKLKKEKEEFEKFSKMNENEQDDFINNILNNMNSPSFLIIDGFNLNLNNKLVSYGFTFYDGLSEQNIQNINNIEFLEALKQNAEEKEQYEFCAKIRDRLNEIKGL
jgi:hypothetical protein